MPHHWTIWRPRPVAPCLRVEAVVTMAYTPCRLKVAMALLKAWETPLRLRTARGQVLELLHRQRCRRPRHWGLIPGLKDPDIPF